MASSPFAMYAYLMYYIPSDIDNDEYCVYDLMYLCIYYMATKLFHCHCHCHCHHCQHFANKQFRRNAMKPIFLRVAHNAICYHNRITVTPFNCHDVPNHGPINYVFNALFRLTTKNIKTARYSFLSVSSPMDSLHPHRGIPLTKAFICYFCCFKHVLQPSTR